MAITVANRREMVWGNARVILADLTSTANTDTWVTGLKKVLQMSIEPTTNVSNGSTKSGGTITIIAASNPLTFNAIAIGY